MFSLIFYLSSSSLSHLVPFQVELKEPKCHICKQQPTVKQSSHIFLSLDKLQEEVREYVEGQLAREDNRWSPNAISIVKGWIKVVIFFQLLLYFRCSGRSGEALHHQRSQMGNSSSDGRLRGQGLSFFLL